MLWECNECGGLSRTVSPVSVCPECGTAGPQTPLSTSSATEFADLREYWVQFGMAQEAPLLDFVSGAQ